MSSRKERRENPLRNLKGPTSCSYGAHNFARDKVQFKTIPEHLHSHTCTECGACYIDRDSICNCKVTNGPE